MRALDPAMPVPLSRKAGYGIGVYGIFIIWMTTAVALMNFYTEVLGLSAQAAGAIFFIASIWDAVTDPAMGFINDRVRSRYGRYRPWILFGAVPFAVSFAAMFWKPAIGDAADLFLWALVLHLIFRTAYTAVYMPYTAMIARLSTNARERASIAGVKNLFTSGAALTVSLFVFDAIDWLGDDGRDPAQGFWRVALAAGAIGVLALFLCFAWTREPPDDAADVAAAAEPIGRQLSLQLGAAFRNRAFWLVFAAVIAFTGCYTMINKAIVYYSQWNLGDRSLAGAALTAIGLAGMVSPLLWIPLSRRWGKKVVWIAGCVLATIALMAIYLAPALSAVPRTALFFMAGVGIHAVLMTFYAALADAADWGEWRSGVRVEAPLFGLVSFANKISLGLGAWVLGLGLDSAGYRGGPGVTAQTPETLEAIRFWMTVAPATGILLSAVIIAFFPVSNFLHARIEAALKTRREEGAGG